MVTRLQESSRALVLRHFGTCWPRAYVALADLGTAESMVSKHVSWMFGAGRFERKRWRPLVRL